MFFICEGIIFYLVSKFEFNVRSNININKKQHRRKMSHKFFNVSTKGLKDHLGCAYINKGTYLKRKLILLK